MEGEMNPSCQEIGIEGCGYVASGDGHALDRMVEHLRREHAYHISVGDITLGRFKELQEPERMIAARLYRRVTEAA